MLNQLVDHTVTAADMKDWQRSHVSSVLHVRIFPGSPRYLKAEKMKIFHRAVKSIWPVLQTPS